MNPIQIKPIGIVRSTRKTPSDDQWNQETTVIELDSKVFTADALQGLSDFSHAEIVFYMNQVPSEKIEISARHPRNNPAWPKVGIFAQRGKNRPNQIGTTVCRIIRIEGLQLYLEGLDAIDLTPVIDIKPWMREFAPRGEVFQPSWVNELMKDYWRN